MWAPTQPGGSLFGLRESNPVDPNLAYEGDVSTFGTADDPMIDRRIGGVNVFGGGLAPYDASGVKIGSIGVSGDTSCADHNIAWRVRDALILDFVPAGVADAGVDDKPASTITSSTMSTRAAIARAGSVTPSAPQRHRDRRGSADLEPDQRAVDDVSRSRAAY